MSSFAVLNDFTDDVLDSLRLKPWWEKCREYAYKTSIAVIALFVFAIESKFKCIRFPNSGLDEPPHLTKVQAMAVDPYCKLNTVHWYVYYDNLITFAVAWITYILANYWVHLTEVKDKLNDISEFGHSFLELNMDLKHMKHWSSHPISASSKHDHRVLRANVLTILKHRHQETLWRQYTIRCVLVLVWTGICSSGSLCLFYKDFSPKHVMDCKIQNDVLPLGKGTSNSFKCVNESSRSTPLLEITFGITLLLQFISMLMALCRDCVSQSQSDIPDFLIWIMAIDVKTERKIRSFVNFVNSDTFNEELIRHADDAFLSGDEEFFRILHENMNDKERFWTVIEAMLIRVLRGGKSNDRKVHDYDLKVYQFLDNTKWINARRNEEFVRRLIQDRQWHLLYCTPTVHNDPSILAEIKFDQLDKEGRSYLFYALRRSSMDHNLLRFSHFNKLMEAHGNRHKTLVHFDGKSMLAEDFFRLEYPELFDGACPNFRLCRLENEAEITNECNSEYEEVCGSYYPVTCNNVGDEASASSASTANNVALQPVTSSRLNSIKLTVLPQPCIIAETARGNKHWEVLVALINTFTVIHELGIRPDTHELIRKDVYSLRDSPDIENIFKEALKTPRDRSYFVPTAAEHILSIMKSEMQTRLIPNIDEAPLTSEMKDRIKKFILSDKQQKLNRAKPYPNSMLTCAPALSPIRVPKSSELSHHWT